MKITPSILLNVILVTVLVTSIFFMNTIAQTGEYDPWVDYDEDGDIDIYDVVNLCNKYGTSGNPAKNVNVTDWKPTYKVLQFVANCSWGPNYHGSNWIPDFSFPVHVGGYSRMFVYIAPVFPNGTEGEYDVTHSLEKLCWCSSVKEWGWGEAKRSEDLSSSASNITVTVHPSGGWGYVHPTIDEHACIEVKAPYFSLLIYSYSTIPSGWMLLTISVYLRNE